MMYCCVTFTLSLVTFACLGLVVGGWDIRPGKTPLIAGLCVPCAPAVRVLWRKTPKELIGQGHRREPFSQESNNLPTTDPKARVFLLYLTACAALFWGGKASLTQ